ncbi:hypothetical protein HYW20_05710 [Candidatus Woesearchaeota archaeon]|nr:hypothetical protein [Candidatus Woesearchaeota archaeon]
MALVLQHRLDEGANINNSIDVIVREINSATHHVKFEIVQDANSTFAELTPGSEEYVGNIHFSPLWRDFRTGKVRVAYIAPREYAILKRVYPPPN